MRYFSCSSGGNPSCPPGIPEVQQEVEHYHLARVRANENSTYAVFAAQKGVSGIFGPDMFLVPRNEVVLNESGFADMTMDTRFILSDESGCPAINLVREKPMLEPDILHGMTVDRRNGLCALKKESHMSDKNMM